jgi:hypothetical protein
MNSFDEVVRVAVVADTDRLSSSHARLLDALAQSTLAGFRVDLPGSGVPVGPRHDLVHVLTATPDAVAVAAEHGIGLVASFPAAATGGLARVCQVPAPTPSCCSPAPVQDSCGAGSRASTPSALARATTTPPHCRGPRTGSTCSPSGSPSIPHCSPRPSGPRRRPSPASTSC